MQVAQTIVRAVAKEAKPIRLSEKEMVILSEIGLDDIPTATSFVEYVAEAYGISASGVWYTLKKLKEKRVVDFTEKGRGEEGKPLSLTAYGKEVIRKRLSGPNGRVPVPEPMMQIGARAYF